MTFVRDEARVEAAWRALEQHRHDTTQQRICTLFDSDPTRFERFSRRCGDLLLDISKTALTDETLRLLSALAEAAGVANLRDAMFQGEPINLTEGRAVLHTALRRPSHPPLIVGGSNVMHEVEAERQRLARFAESLRVRHVLGATGSPIEDVVNIGIGGSDLGPAMATAALRPYHDGPRIHFVSNVDGAHLADTLKGLRPDRTLFIVASKTFTTVETLTNAQSARRWLTASLGEAAVAAHFAAISTAQKKVAAFGIAEGRTFGFWDWVGGRYSVWSAIGLPLMIAIGPRNFEKFLLGAHGIDEHFRTAPLAENLPMLLGLTGAWHRVVCGYPTRAILPYDQRLALLPAYLQQLDMESNGKSVMRDGRLSARSTGPVVWGASGTNGQHAFHQLLHQGTDIVPAEFMIAADGHEPELAHHHVLLVANCLAQSEALMRGRTVEEARDLMLKQGKSAAEAERLAAHRTFPGNRPSITIAYRRLDPFTLGRVLALYEHRVFVEAALYGINAFDQFGVELGKELAEGLGSAAQGRRETSGLSSSTQGLSGYIRGIREG
ncbi:MAG: glucose-6-phosphate isomerase [Hyphomicrobiaceae bacterium]